MRVSLRDILIAAALALTPGAAQAGCCIGAPPPPPPACGACMAHTPSIETSVPAPRFAVPDLSVNAGAVSVAQASASASASAEAESDAESFAFAGGRGFVGGVGVLDGLDAALSGGGAQLVLVTAEPTRIETRLVKRLAAVRAACVDPRGARHAARATFAGRAVPQLFRGELFRCPAADQRLEAEIARAADGAEEFAGAERGQCLVGEALIYDGAEILCRPADALSASAERAMARVRSETKVVELSRRETVRTTTRRDLARTEATGGHVAYDDNPLARSW